MVRISSAAGGGDQLGRGVVREVEGVRRDAVSVVAEAREDGVAEGLGTREEAAGAAWATDPTVSAVAAPIRAVAGAVTLVLIPTVRFRWDVRMVGSGRRSKGDHSA
ncbi:hypothetical protein SALBM311S_01249 [Streptomyces alboniger]